MIYDKLQIKSVSNILKKNITNYWTGNECKKFEQEFSNYHNLKYSVAVSNGSVAIELAMKALNLSENDEIIVSPRSFIISASCVLNQKLKPVFSDVDHNGNLSIAEITRAYNKKVKGIILVHLNGLPCDMDPIIKFAKQKNIFVIEDCSQAHGAIYKGKKVGTFGDVAIWSFCQDKIISTGGEGGMISTNNKRIWKKCWSYKDHGKNYKKIKLKKNNLEFLWLHDDLGSNYRMTEMQAAIGRIQLKKLNRQIIVRNQIANIYLNGLKKFFVNKFFITPNFNCDSCKFKYLNKNKCNLCIHSFYRLNLFLNKTKINRSELLKELNLKKIKCGVGPCPEIYREKVFKKLKVNPKKRLTNAKKLGEISLIFHINAYKSLIAIKKEVSLIQKIIKKFIN